jgi:hypothetical protein
MDNRNHRTQSSTQWTAQFLVASELCRRDYTVSFTMGNTTPMADLMVGTHDGQMFWIDVKGQRGPHPWMTKRKRPLSGLYYVFVVIGNERSQDRFLIATQDEVNQEVAAYRESHPNNHTDTVRFNNALRFENRWEILPSVSAISTVNYQNWQETGTGPDATMAARPTER